MLYHPVTPVIIYGTAMLVALAAMGQVFFKTFEEGVSFDASTTQLKIVSSELHFGETKAANTIAILGTVRNDTDTTWKDVTFQVQFTNSVGQLTDAAQKQDYSLTIPARQSIPFKASIPREFPTNAFAAHSVRIVSAKDVRARF